MQTVDVGLFKNSVAFSLMQTRWGNRRKANIEGVTTDSDKSLLRLSKLLVESEDYEKIVSFQGETRSRIEAMSVPSFFRRGIQLIATSRVKDVEEYLTRRVAEQEQLVMKFAETYPAAIIDAGQRLKQFFRPGDYPQVDVLIQSFSLRWNWIAFGVPDSLPRELFEAEKAKAERIWNEASEQITLCLREGFKELVEHMVERLTVQPGEKKKVFRDSLIGNVIEFIDMFQGRNITNDVQLEQLINKAKEVVTGVKPDDLRGDDDLRARMAANFAELKTNVDRLIVEMPRRSFDFEE